MAKRDGTGAKKVEVSAVDKTYKLQTGNQQMPICSRVRIRTDHSPKRPNISCGIPRGFHKHFWTGPHRRSDWRTCFGVLRICRIRATEITELDIREPDIPFSVVYEDIVEFNIFHLKFSETVGKLLSKALTCVYIAFFMEHLQCFKYASGDILQFSSVQRLLDRCV